MSEIKKVVLAYSGGLDTSVIIPWLKEHYDNCEVIAVCGNVGQDDELDDLKQRAVASGASKLYVEDLTDEFVNEFVIPTMQAGADYEGYLLGTSLARPILAKRVMEIAKAEGADAVCHGSTGKGNDQVRFELAIMHFAPEMKIITPWREWDIQSRNEEIDYAEAHHIPLKINRETNYSKDKNLWHLSHEGLDLEDPGNEPQYEKEGLVNNLVRFLGNQFYFISPEELRIPEYLKEDTLHPANSLYWEVSSLEDTLPKLDVLYMTRVQKERFFNEEDYIRLKSIYTLDPEKMKLARPDMPVLHPLPRVDEITRTVDDDPRAAYFDQVQNGVYVRMALIMALLGIADPVTGEKVLKC